MIINKVISTYVLFPNNKIVKQDNLRELEVNCNQHRDGNKKCSIELKINDYTHFYICEFEEFDELNKNDIKFLKDLKDTISVAIQNVILNDENKFNSFDDILNKKHYEKNNYLMSEIKKRKVKWYKNNLAEPKEWG